MKLGFVINDLRTERSGYTTTRLARAAITAGHEAWLIGVGELGQDPCGRLFAHAHTSDEPGESLADFLRTVRSKDGRHERISVDELDALMLRNDPANDAVTRPWAVTAGVLFGQLAVARDVLVVNDPASLANALNKTYFQHFPDTVRPNTLISREIDDIKAFVEAQGDRVVLKPLQGSGGGGVFVVDDVDSPNLNQIVEAISRDGYVVAQEYLPDAVDGDVRLFVMNGQPLEVDGRVAALRRVNESSDIRSNVSAGGRVREAEVTDEMRRVVELVRPKLLDDGMFLVGLDIVGDKLMEINVFSPGGLGICHELYGVDFPAAVVEALAAKSAVRNEYPGHIGNAQLAAT